MRETILHDYEEIAATFPSDDWEEIGLLQVTVLAIRDQYFDFKPEDPLNPAFWVPSQKAETLRNDLITGDGPDAKFRAANEILDIVKKAEPREVTKANLLHEALEKRKRKARRQNNSVWATRILKTRDAITGYEQQIKELEVKIREDMATIEKLTNLQSEKIDDLVTEPSRSLDEGEDGRESLQSAFPEGLFAGGIFNESDKEEPQALAVKKKRASKAYKADRRTRSMSV